MIHFGIITKSSIHPVIPIAVRSSSTPTPVKVISPAHPGSERVLVSLGVFTRCPIHFSWLLSVCRSVNSSWTPTSSLITYLVTLSATVRPSSLQRKPDLAAHICILYSFSRSLPKTCDQSRRSEKKTVIWELFSVSQLSLYHHHPHIPFYCHC